jgi:hypothetical protein
MLKTISLMLTLIVYFGGCQMDTNVAKSQTVESSIEKKILEHAGQNFSLDPAKVTLTASTVKSLPEGVESYYLEEKGSYGNKFHNYLVYNGKLFCSGTDGDFGKFLKEKDFLNKNNLNPEQFWTVFQSLRFPYKTAVLVNEEQMKTPASALKSVIGKTGLPKLEVSPNEAVFTFFVVDTNVNAVRKYIAEVSSDYNVNLTFSPVK